MPVSRDMLGRVFNGSGKPIDGGCANHARSADRARCIWLCNTSSCH